MRVEVNGQEWEVIREAEDAQGREWVHAYGEEPWQATSAEVNYCGLVINRDAGTDAVWDAVEREWAMRGLVAERAMGLVRHGEGGR